MLNDIRQNTHKHTHWHTELELLYELMQIMACFCLLPLFCVCVTPFAKPHFYSFIIIIVTILPQL